MFGRMIAIVLAIMLTVSVPMGFVFTKTEKTKQRYAIACVTQFYEEIRKDCELTAKRWEQLLVSLSRNGILYDVSVYVGDMKEEATYSPLPGEEEAKGRSSRFYQVTDVKEVMETMQPDGVYRLRKGNFVTVRLRRRKKTTLTDVVLWPFELLLGYDGYTTGGIV